jgi:hypothetical protein
LRRIALTHTQFAQATCGKIRLKTAEIRRAGAREVRRTKVAMASAWSYQNEFALDYALLRNAVSAP